MISRGKTLSKSRRRHAWDRPASEIRWGWVTQDQEGCNRFRAVLFNPQHGRVLPAQTRWGWGWTRVGAGRISAQGESGSLLEILGFRVDSWGVGVEEIECRVAC